MISREGMEAARRRPASAIIEGASPPQTPPAGNSVSCTFDQ
jgi:hypothetical protein